MTGEDCFRCRVNGELVAGCDGCSESAAEPSLEDRVDHLEENLDGLAFLIEEAAKVIRAYSEANMLLTRRVVSLERRLGEFRG